MHFMPATKIESCAEKNSSKITPKLSVSAALPLPNEIAHGNRLLKSQPMEDVLHPSAIAQNHFEEFAERSRKKALRHFEALSELGHLFTVGLT